jgi:hypothetical protein
MIQIVNEKIEMRDAPHSAWATFIVNSENPELGRAWIMVQVEGTHDDPNLNREEVFLKRKVLGLSFNSLTNEIVYLPKDSKTPITCGKFSEGNLFKQSSISPSGNCRLKSRINYRPYDDGFYVKEKPYITVNLQIL